MAKVQEIWKPVPDTNLLISNQGNLLRVKEVPNGFKIVSPRIRRDKGYSVLRVGKTRTSIHRLVATAFIPNPMNKPAVNHKNGIKHDNRVENLEWCTTSENTLHAIYELKTSVRLPPKEVEVFKKGVKVFHARSTSEAAKFVGGNKAGVSRCCLNKQQIHKDHRFRFYEEGNRIPPPCGIPFRKSRKNYLRVNPDGITITR